MAIQVSFGPADWERVRGDYARWWAHDLERPLVQIGEKVWSEDHPPYPVQSFASNYGLEMPAEEIVAQYGGHLEAQRFYGDAFPRWWVNYGPGILAGFMGARVHSVPETVWFEPVEEMRAEDLTLSMDEENVWWQRVLEITRTAADAWGDQALVGFTDFGGNLDVLASFRTTQGLIYDLYDAPEALDRLVSEVTAHWLRCYERQYEIIRQQRLGTTPWAPIWSESTCYMLQCDFGYMISPEMFERFVIPDLTACCERLEHGFYHLDGPGQIAHVDLLLEMPRLRGIQWIPGDGNPPPEGWPELLSRFIDGGKLCQLFVTAQGAHEIVKTVGGRGMLLAITDEMSADEAEAYIKVLARDDISR